MATWNPSFPPLEKGRKRHKWVIKIWSKNANQINKVQLLLLLQERNKEDKKKHLAESRKFLFLSSCNLLFFLFFRLIVCEHNAIVVHVTNVAAAPTEERKKENLTSPHKSYCSMHINKAMATEAFDNITDREGFQQSATTVERWQRNRRDSYPLFISIWSNHSWALMIVVPTNHLDRLASDNSHD